MDFSDDMQTFKARGNAGHGKDGWDGTYSRRITSAVSSEQLEKIVASGKWRIDADDEKSGSVVFGPKLVKVEGLDLPWKKWKILDGILVISDLKKVVSEFYLDSNTRPYSLKGLTSKQSKWRLVEPGIGEE